MASELSMHGLDAKLAALFNPTATLDWSEAETDVAPAAVEARESAGACTCDPETDPVLRTIFDPGITVDWSAVDPNETATAVERRR